jgi:hypothetical protein
MEKKLKIATRNYAFSKPGVIIPADHLIRELEKPFERFFCF